MGKPIGTGSYKNQLYAAENPFAVLADDGTALVSWEDSRTVGTPTGLNIYIRHLDDLDPNLITALPKNWPVFQLTKGTNTFATPLTLLGISQEFTTIQTQSYQTNLNTTVMAVQDVENLGTVNVQVYENMYNVRKTNDTLFLDRNFLLRLSNEPSIAGGVPVVLYLTKQSFDALKEAGSQIDNPGHLLILKQPNAGTINRSAYVTVPGEQVVKTE